MPLDLAIDADADADDGIARALLHLICYRPAVVASRGLLPDVANRRRFYGDYGSDTTELTDAVMERYRRASAGERSRILDEFAALTGFHRKHAIRVLNTKEDTPKTSTAIARVRPRLYDEAVRQAVVVLWEASDRICGKHLRPLLPILVAALEKHGTHEAGRRRSLAGTDRKRVDARPSAP